MESRGEYQLWKSTLGQITDRPTISCYPPFCTSKAAQAGSVRAVWLESPVCLPHHAVTTYHLLAHFPQSLPFPGPSLLSSKTIHGFHRLPALTAHQLPATSPSKRPPCLVLTHSKSTSTCSAGAKHCAKLWAGRKLKMGLVIGSSQAGLLSAAESACVVTSGPLPRVYPLPGISSPLFGSHPKLEMAVTSCRKPGFD